jgi:hypothetical protein
VPVAWNAFSKKSENHAAVVALGYVAYWFIKIHPARRCTPDMAAGVADLLLESRTEAEEWRPEKEQ